MNMKLPKLILEKFSGNPLDWPEWSGQFLATVDQAQVDDGIKMNYLKTLVSGRAKAAIEGMGYNAGTYKIAWDILSRDFGRPELIVNSQLKRLHSYPFIKPHDYTEVIKFSHIVSSCVNVLSQYGYENDLCSESVLNNAVRKLPNDLKAKWLAYLQRFDKSFKTMRVFNGWLKNIAEVQESLKLQFDSNSGKPKSNHQKEKTTSLASDAQEKPNKRTSECPLKDGEHKIWNCTQFKKMSSNDRNEAVKRLNLCFCCLNGGHRATQCKLKRNCGKDGCSRKHNRLLHKDDQNEANPSANLTDPVLTANACSGILQVVAIQLSNGMKTMDTLAVCDTGSTLSFIDSTVKTTLGLEGTKLTLSVAGINGSMARRTWSVKRFL